MSGHVQPCIERARQWSRRQAGLLEPAAVSRRAAVPGRGTRRFSGCTAATGRMESTEQQRAVADGVAQEIVADYLSTSDFSSSDTEYRDISDAFDFSVDLAAEVRQRPPQPLPKGVVDRNDALEERALEPDSVPARPAAEALADEHAN